MNAVDEYAISMDGKKYASFHGEHVHWAQTAFRWTKKKKNVCVRAFLCILLIEQRRKPIVTAKFTGVFNDVYYLFQLQPSEIDGMRSRNLAQKQQITKNRQ